MTPLAHEYGGTLLSVAERARPASRASRDGLVLTAAGPDEGVRWREGQRLEHLWEECCEKFAALPAVDGAQGPLSYAELDARANGLARFLSSRGVAPGDRVGLLFDDPLDGYLGMLAVLKLHAAYVPLDPAFPPDRVSYIVDDAGASAVMSRSHLDESLSGMGDEVRLLYLDQEADAIAAERGERLAAGEAGAAVDELCYVVYTSGTTGRPKGVAVSHPSICNFVQVAADTYGISNEDRVFQGLTIAFDFSVEETWVPWMVGATLVPKPSGLTLLGAELREFLEEHRVSALCCVPTLLATLEDDLPGLRFLLVSGESCPQDLVDRWWRPDRRFLNVYGPTEATVSATWALLHPHRPVSIGAPLPTYAIVILDPEEDRALPLHEEGEIGIAGIGLADGYLGDPERTARAFVPDFLSIPGNSSGRIYRSGDLGRVNGEGELQHLGRIDTQVKVRGYRIELTEIEAVLRQVPGVGQAVLRTFEAQPGVTELVAYVTPEPDAGPLSRESTYALLRERLPPYMVPAYLERLHELPLMPSGKVDRDRLPPPDGSRRWPSQGAHGPPATALELTLAETLASVLDLERVSVTGHFFHELGASSLLMARWSAELRRHRDVPPVSMRDVYLQPTIRSLATALSQTAEALSTTPAWREPGLPAATGTPRYLLCGALQLLAFFGYVCLAALPFDPLAVWLAAGHGVLDLYGRAVVFGGGALLAAGLLPILAKWVLIGRWKPQRIRLWSLRYVRFWVVKTLVISNPVAHLFVGTSLYGLYLRALGARVGRGALILTHHVPVCTDLLSIGADSVIRKDTYLNGYRARAGSIETGAITLGAQAFVGEHAVLDIETSLGDGAGLGHASSLHAGQVVPAGQYWHGSPAQAAGTDHHPRTIPSRDCSSWRRARYSATRLLVLVALVGPLQAALWTLLLTRPKLMQHLSGPGYLVVAAIVVLGLVLMGLIVSLTLPRLLTRALKPGRVYPLHGPHYTLQRIITRTSNISSLTTLFGDSAAIVGYLRMLGYRLGLVEQTGSNFGTEVKHEVPALCEVGSGTMVSDGLSMLNAEFSSSSFRVLPVRVGEGNFLGNNIVYPPGGRTGENCLLATKVMIPLDGPVRHDVGLLGSPCFEIPRSAEGYEELKKLGSGTDRQPLLRAKTRHNVVTMALHLTVRVLFLAAMIALAASPLDGGSGLRAVAGTAIVGLLDVAVAPAILFVLVERATTGFRPLVLRVCSILQVHFWRHERYWKVPVLAYLHVFDGTPFKNLIWRLLGVRVGRGVF
ncbi:MAG: amino acid adenylation domain-containing protein, partial [Actinomycetota bacterium]|nr:amino acid adenylation domain-containing protein [Actinomycetota bacterium]